MPSVLITGGHKGVGLETSRMIAAKGGYDLLIAGRDLPEIERVAADLHREFGTKVLPLEVDLSSLVSVRAAAAAARQKIERGDILPLYALLLNAGAEFTGPVGYSADGYDLTFATNCLGHFVLLNLLLDNIAAHGRIVFTASGTHDPATMDGKMVGAAVEPDAIALANQGKAGKAISGGQRYTTSKLCTILYAYELDRRLRAVGSHIVSVAFDPGLIPETGLIVSMPSLAKSLMKTRLMKSVLKALGTTIGDLKFSGDMLGRIAIDPAYANASGKFLQSNSMHRTERRSSPMSYDQALAKRLWKDSIMLGSLTALETPNLLNPAPVLSL